MKEVVSAFIERDGKILLVRRPLHKKRGGLWEFPGGKVEEGETYNEAIVRELKEELALTVVPRDILAKITYSYNDEVIELILIRVEIKNEPQLKEHQELIWIPLKEAFKLDLCEADKKLIETLLNKNS